MTDFLTTAGAVLVILVAIACGYNIGKSKAYSVVYPIQVYAPHDTTAIDIHFGGDELHCFILDQEISWQGPGTK